MTTTPDRSEIRAATFLAAQARLDAPGRSRSGKTRRNVKCTPPNKLCGNRCIPPNWDCRLKGQGADNHVNANKTDPLAGIASLQRGAKDLARGIATINPSRVQRGRSSVIRGVVKLTPGDDLEKKKRLKRQLTDASTPIAAVLGVALVGIASHTGMKRAFSSYRRGVGADIDQAAARAVDSVLDRLPGVAGPRAATRAAAAAAANDISTSALRGARMQSVRQATSGNTRRIGPLSFRPNAANYESSNLVNNLNALKAKARSGGLSYDEWQRSSVQTLYGARSPGSRSAGQRGSVFSEDAANEFLVSKFKLSGQGAIGSNSSFSISARNDLVEQQLGERLSSWGQTLRDDMHLRRYASPTGQIRSSDINRYIKEVGTSGITTRITSYSAAERRQLTSETIRLMRTAIRGNTTSMTTEARSMRRALIDQYDNYFSDIAQGMQRNAVASDSPFGDGMTGLARYVTRTTGRPTQILSRDHADLILRHHYHTKVMQLKSDFTIGDNTARRVAQQLTRSPELPDTDTAYRILKESGFPRLNRTGPITGRAPGEGASRRSAATTTEFTATPQTTTPSTTPVRSNSQTKQPLINSKRKQVSAATLNRMQTVEELLPYSPFPDEPHRARLWAERMLELRKARGDSLPPRVRTYLEAQRRLDLQAGEDRSGKPCGRSFIPKGHKCGQGTVASAQSSNSTNKLKVAALVAGATAVVATGSLTYRNREKILQRTLEFQHKATTTAIRKLSSERTKAILSKLPDPFRDKARGLVGQSKKGLAAMLLASKNSKLIEIDKATNSFTFAHAGGGHTSISSFKDTLVMFTTMPERSIEFGGDESVPRSVMHFTVDGQYERAASTDRRHNLTVASKVKTLFEKQLTYAPDKSYITVEPYSKDGLGTKRRNIYELFGFTPIGGEDSTHLWAFKQGTKLKRLNKREVYAVRAALKARIVKRADSIKSDLCPA